MLAFIPTYGMKWPADRLLAELQPGTAMLKESPRTLQREVGVSPAPGSRFAADDLRSWTSIE